VADQVPIVFLHGLVVSGEYFQPLVSRLDPGMRLYIPDFPGFGKSSSAKSFESIAAMTEMFAAWLDREQIGHACLIANSLGCQIVTQLAVTRPDLVDRFILISPTMNPAIRSVLHIAWLALLDVPRERQSLWRIWIRDFLRAGPVLAIRTLRIGIADPQLERLPQIAQPGLLIGGEHDPVVSPRWIRRMEVYMHSVRTVIIEGAPHALNYSAAREVARIIRTALQDT
jgi:pimeloyl-ACP methyl ester carboxylesterase